MFTARKLLVFLLCSGGILLFSCNKEKDVIKELLQKHDWEQLSFIHWDTSYSEHKFFHTLRFNPDDTYFMETNWSFYQLLMYTESGVYEYHSDGERIVFPGAIDTVVFDELGGNYPVFLNPWQILQLCDTLLVVRSDPDYQPHQPGYVRYVDDTLYFRPKER